MNINDIIKASNKPAIYTKGTAVMWTDEHISKQLLAVHLNPEIDLASRRQTTIAKTIDWILAKAPNEKMNILDLGCGPGLYAEALAMKGHNVTGVDFSRSSVEYAKGESAKKNLGITYRRQNYLELDEEAKYDLVILIYTDFGVLSPDERKILLENIYRALKPGGTFIFDVLNDKDLKKKITGKTWETVPEGFWRSAPYLALSDSILYEEEKVILYQHIIIEEDSYDVYRFYTHFFANSDLNKILQKHEFKIEGYYEDVLPDSDLWSGDNVTFFVTKK